LAGVSTDGAEPGSGGATLFGSFFGFNGNPTLNERVWFTAGIGSPASPTEDQYTSPQTDGGFSAGIGTASDRTYQFRAKGYSQGTNHSGSIQSFKSFALAPTAGTPTSSAVTKNSATIACTYDPKVVESSFTVTLYYRKFGDVTWIAAGASQSSGSSISRDLSGLLAYTTYQFKLAGSRTTTNSQSWESVVSSFTTLADAPTVVTNPANLVTSSQAQLNGTVDPTGVAGVSVQFGWGTADGGAVLGSWQNATTPQSVSGDGDQAFQELISGLSPSTQYFHRAFVNW
jgi:hypothetical protein